MGAEASISVGNAIKNGDIATMLQLKASHPQLINNPIDSDGSTALIRAAGKGKKAIVNILITAGADLNRQTTKDGCTALILASRFGYKDCVSMLLGAGADTSIQDKKSGKSALGLAISLDRMDIVKLWIDIGSPVFNKERLAIISHTAFTEDHSIVSSIVSSFNPFPEGSRELHADAANFWIKLLSSTDCEDLYVSEVSGILDTHINMIQILADVRDPSGRRAVDIATPSYKKLMVERLLFLRRYELKEGPAEHTSATCIVRLAKDFCSGGKWVALKFMQHKDQFLREVEFREQARFDNEYVISILHSYNAETDEVYRAEAAKTGFYPFCVVMPAAERNLGTVLAHEHIAGRDWTQLRVITQQIVEAAGHMHSKGLIHGDIKPSNIMRIGGRFSLIDLDATVSFVDKQYVGAKYSSGFVPPEMVAVLGDSTAVIRTYTTENSSGEPVLEGLKYDLVPAHPAHDMWSLGVTLFQMYSGDSLFLLDDEGNIDQSQLHILSNWTNLFKAQRLDRVKHREARNLISRLLSKDPVHRPDASHILAHPFVTGKPYVRMVGEEPEYDVFISYRVASDSHHAQILYDRLTARGLKVWWDKMCLHAGLSWEAGFCTGLVNSRTFVCLLSRDGIHNPDIDRQNFGKLTRDSQCDNVFLDHRLALELRDMGLLERVCPIMIGNEISGVPGTYSRYNEWGNWASSEFIMSVEAKLREHLEREGLGSPLVPEASPSDTLNKISQNQGFFIEGNGEESFADVCNRIVRLIHELKTKSGVDDVINSIHPRDSALSTAAAAEHEVTLYDVK